MASSSGGTPQLRLGVSVFALAVGVAGCSTSGAAVGSDPVAVDGATAVSREVVVSAAASLTDAFVDLEGAFESRHPDADVVLNLAGSSTLREQILGGAPTDVLATANTATMDQVVEAGRTSGDPAIFVRNRLQIAVPAGNPADVEGLEDFADDSLFLGLCAEQVPCGDFARQALAEAGVNPAIDTNEPDVRALLTKIAAGELDAGVTYVTDVVAAGRSVASVDIPAGGSVESVDIPADGSVESVDIATSGSVEGVEIPDAVNVTATYPIAVLDDAPNPAGAEAFVDFVLSEEGQTILHDWGFASP